MVLLWLTEDEQFQRFRAQRRGASEGTIVEIKGRAVLITGASEGIGAACVEAFRRRGARVSLVARSRDKLEAVGAGDAVITAGDITDPAVQDEAVQRTVNAFGTVDILVNNAGRGIYCPSWRAPMEHVREMFEVNFFAALSLAQRVVPIMQQQRRGSIVNVGSIGGKVTLPWMTLYSASKYAVGSWTDGLRMELRHYGIHAMTVCPGYVQTNFQRNVLPGYGPPAAVRRLRRSAITPEQCAEAIARGVERDARTVVTPRIGWLFVLAERLAPKLVDSRMAAVYREGEREWSA